MIHSTLKNKYIHEARKLIMKKIKAITIKAIPDYDSDLSFLGTFGNEAGEFAIKHNGERNSYPYFNADNVENMEQAQANYERIMKYDNGELQDYGVKAEAEILTSDDGRNWLINKVSSGGLWGLSSDGTVEEFEDEAENQKMELIDVLQEFGFTIQEIEAVNTTKEDWPY